MCEQGSVTGKKKRCLRGKKRTLESKDGEKGKMCCWQRCSFGFDSSAHIVTHNLSTATFTFQTHGGKRDVRNGGSEGFEGRRKVERRFFL